jgi:hypothetical protein
MEGNIGLYIACIKASSTPLKMEQSASNAPSVTEPPVVKEDEYCTDEQIIDLYGVTKEHYDSHRNDNVFIKFRKREFEILDTCKRQAITNLVTMMKEGLTRDEMEARTDKLMAKNEYTNAMTNLFMLFRVMYSAKFNRQTAERTPPSTEQQVDGARDTNSSTVEKNKECTDAQLMEIYELSQEEYDSIKHELVKYPRKGHPYICRCKGLADVKVEKMKQKGLTKDAMLIEAASVTFPELGEDSTRIVRLFMAVIIRTKV